MLSPRKDDALYRSDWGFADQIFAEGQILENYLVMGKDVFMAFIDLENEQE